MYDPVDNQVSFPGLGAELLKNWSENNTFEKSLAQSDREIVFYDGPPFPTGAPHHGTLFVSILKDSLARYFTMRGASVPRVWGWDCHGLPIENAVERKMGIENKSEIETKYSVEEFNNECREFVSHCNDSWEEYITRVGRWVDYKNAYRTLDLDYMESVMWVFKSSYDKDLMYKDYRVTPYCYHCETALSISDTRESDSTRPRQDPTLVVRFRAAEDVEGKPTWFLAWTTTPWTLTSNLALAVGPDLDYVAFEQGDDVYIMGASRLAAYSAEFGEDPTIVARYKGSELVDQAYEPMFPYFEELKQDNYFRILSADFVSLDDGVGIVHVAPAFGEDDYWVCKRNGLSVRNPVDSKGCFDETVPDFSGRNVHECNKDVIRFLKDRGVVLQHKTVEHNYPHCWRCRQPLIYRAMDAWYFAVEKIKDRMVELNGEINWVPGHVKEGRFGKWLEGARDWNISRNRYWGTPIPVWECSGDGCDQRVVPGSLDDIESLSGTRPTDLHKEVLDTIEIECDKCGSSMKRVSEVLDCWFESGSMPYGQCHYPFENQDWFESHFPADFIVEYPGQIRGWFYYLHVLSTALMDRPAFKNCLVHGTLLAEDGKKISKSLQNYTDPMALLDKYGADALRVYLMSSPAAAMMDLSFKDSGIADQIRNVLLPIWNSYSFFVTYATIDDFSGDPDFEPQPEHVLDRWILAALYRTEREVCDAFESYHLNRSLSPVLEFIGDLTNWYIRRSRERFWASGFESDKEQAYQTLYYVLVTLSKLLAPSAPFISDSIYQNLTSRESVHLASWPAVSASYEDVELINEIEVARSVSSLGLALRQKKKLKVRQPLSCARVALPSTISPEVLLRQLEVVKDELNVQDVVIMDDPTELATLRATPDARILGPLFGREVQGIIKAAKQGDFREDGDSIVVIGPDKEWTINKDNIDIGYEGRDGHDVVSDGGILVSLDCEITPELHEDFVMRELNRCVQDLRKKAGYAVNDRILLGISGELESGRLTRLAELTLATLSDVDVPDESTELDVDGRCFDVSICTAP